MWVLLFWVFALNFLFFPKWSFCNVLFAVIFFSRSHVLYKLQAHRIWSGFELGSLFSQQVNSLFLHSVLSTRTLIPLFPKKLQQVLIFLTKSCLSPLKERCNIEKYLIFIVILKNGFLWPALMSQSAVLEMRLHLNFRKPNTRLVQQKKK